MKQERFQSTDRLNGEANALPPGRELASVEFREALRFWMKLGFISFGGPAGQISIMHTELVERRRWISEQRFLHALNYCMVLPGPEAQQLATYVGWLMHGVRGGLTAGVLFVLPSLVILIGLSWAYLAFGESQLVQGMLVGLQPAVVGIVAGAVLRLAGRAIRHPSGALLAIAAFAAIWWGAPFPAIVASAGILGYFIGLVYPASFVPAVHQANVHAPAVPSAFLDDHHPMPSQALISLPRWTLHVAVGFIAWAVPLGFLSAWAGPQHPIAAMGWFFTKAALVTFGGAYAVLPYVVHEAALAGWCYREQALVGLALGESTPGPLIMFVAFVGFVGGWNTTLSHATMSGHIPPWLAGIAGAVVATYFTFLPSILFVLLGAPFIERTRGQLRLASMLAGITAAVVGVMAHLAVFLANEIVWKASDLRWMTLLIAVGSFVAVRWRRAEISQVVLATAAIGVALKMATARY